MEGNAYQKKIQEASKPKVTPKQTFWEFCAEIESRSNIVDDHERWQDAFDRALSLKTGRFDFPAAEDTEVKDA